MSFEDHLAEAQAVIYGGLGDPDAVFEPKDGAPFPDPVSVILRKPKTTAQLQDISIVPVSPFVRVPVSQVPVLKKGDSFVLGGRRWRVEEPPIRPDSGFHWVASVADVGPAE